MKQGKQVQDKTGSALRNEPNVELGLWITHCIERIMRKIQDTKWGFKNRKIK
jgi:hypothetical protein